MHTPGPWKYVNDAICAGDGSIVMCVYASAKCGRGADDYYSCCPPSAEVTVRWKSENDRALPLAAPDLLAAAKGIDRLWLIIENAVLNTDHHEAVLKALKENRAACDKATGVA